MLKPFAILAFAAAATLVPLSLDACGAGFSAEAQRSCCRVCTKGKACGNSCIARHLNCHRGQGCACNSR